MKIKTKIGILILGLILLVGSIYFVSAAISPITPSLNLDGQNRFTIQNYANISNVPNINSFRYVQQNNGSDIQTKINSCSNSGCTVIIPDGTYEVTALVINRSNINLVGAGWNTIIKQIDSVTGGDVGIPCPVVISVYGDNKNIVIRDLMIDGNGDTNLGTCNATSTLGQASGIDGTYQNAAVQSSNILIDHVFVNNTIRTGISIRDSTTVQNSLITNSWTDHPVYFSASHDSTLKNSVIGGFFSGSLINVGTTAGSSSAFRSLISNNVITDVLDNPNASIDQNHIVEIRTGTQQLTISNNRFLMGDFSPNLIEAVVFDDGDYTSILGNTFIGSSDGGGDYDSAIMIRKGTGKIIANNKISNLTGNSAGINLIGHADNGSNILITNNQIYSLANSIRAYLSATGMTFTNLRITNNYLSSNNSNSIRFYGAGSIEEVTIAGNIFDSYSTPAFRNTMEDNATVLFIDHKPLINFIDYNNATLNNTRLDWEYLFDYPVACPSGSYLTQLGDSVTCTAISAITNNLNVSGNFTNNLVPQTNNLYSIGSTLLRWLKGWFVNLDVSGTATINNTAITNASIINLESTNITGTTFYFQNSTGSLKWKMYVNDSGSLITESI